MWWGKDDPMDEVKKKVKKKVKEKISEKTITLHHDDDLMTRSEKIVASMGFTGAVGGYEKQVYRILQKYKEYDDAYKETR